MKDIKERKVDKSIKSIDKKETITHFLKKATVSTKNHVADSTNKDESKNAEQQAIQKVTNGEKKIAGETLTRGRRLLVNRINKGKIKEEKKGNNIGQAVKQRKEFIKIKKSQKLSKSKEGNIKVNHIGHKRLSLKKTSKAIDKKVLTNQSYQNHMRIFHIRKKQKLMQEKTFKTVQKRFNPIKNLFSGIGKITMKLFSNPSTIFGIGGAFIVLVVFVLFIGLFASLAGGSGSNTATSNIAPEVFQYEELVEKYTKQYEIPEYKNLVFAVMMQESGGKGDDPMQSSESEYNQKYPKQPNGITDPEYSIDCGVHYLSDCLKKGEAKDPSDIDRISLSLQGYNFGNGYIDWAITNFNGYSRANAKVFSDEMKRELGVSVYGDPEYVPNVLRYYHLGNGNMVMIAQSQVGNVGGRIYWSWYGYTSRVEWCACFVSWIANEAGLIDKGVTPKFANCQQGIGWFKEHKQWKINGIIPEPGYIIFFDWDGDGISDHVGIVEKVEKNNIITIEGNSTNDECRRNTYEIKSKYIVGYGVY